MSGHDYRSGDPTVHGVAPPEVQTTDIYRGVLPFIGLQLVALLVVILFPELVTGLLD